MAAVTADVGLGQKRDGTEILFGGDVFGSDIRSGESLTIIGGSGVGKSVMLKMLIGLLKVDAGSILYVTGVVSKSQLGWSDWFPFFNGEARLILEA